MMTFNDVRLRYVVFVRCERHKYMRLSVIQSDLHGYSCTNTMVEKWKDLKAATAFRIFFLCISNRKVLRKKSQLYCELLENINFAFRLT